jgi:hypothetical protein
LGFRGWRDGKQVPGLLVRGDGVGPPSRHAEPVAAGLDLCIVGGREDLQDRYRLTRRTRRLCGSAPGRQDQKSRERSSDAKSRHCVLRYAMIRIGTGRRDATLTQMGIFRAKRGQKTTQLSASSGEVRGGFAAWAHPRSYLLPWPPLDSLERRRRPSHTAVNRIGIAEAFPVPAHGVSC